MFQALCSLHHMTILWLLHKERVINTAFQSKFFLAYSLQNYDSIFISVYGCAHACVNYKRNLIHATLSTISTKPLLQTNICLILPYVLPVVVDCPVNLTLTTTLILYCQKRNSSPSEEFEDPSWVDLSPKMS